MSETWTPVISGNYPKERENVQVTYRGYIDGKYYCDAFAYRENNQWFWTNEEGPVIVQIVAWKRNCEAYDPEIELKRLFRNAVISQQDELEFYSEILSLGYTVDIVRDLIGTETAEHMYIFCVNHGLLEDHRAAYLYTAVCRLLKANAENTENDYWTDGNDIICKTQEQANVIADLFEDMGADAMLTAEENDGWHVYFD